MGYRCRVAGRRAHAASRRGAELGNNLRVALWRLDGRLLPALGGEDSRPFYHYASADPRSGSTAGPTPLLAAQLPDWMKLHAQVDSVNGWDSPQVLAPDAAARVTDAWPDLRLRNNTADRAAVLNSLRTKYPAFATCELLAARERATPGDGRPFAAPWFDPDALPPAPELSAFAPPVDSVSKPPPPPEMGPINVPPAGKPAASFKVFGWELVRRDGLAGDLRRGDGSPSDQKNLGQTNPQAAPPPAQVAETKAPAFPPKNAPQGGAVGRNGPPLTENDRQLLEFLNRVGPIARGMQEAKNAGQDFSQYGRNSSQNVPNTTNQMQLGNGMTPASGAGPQATFANPKDGKDKDAAAKKDEIAKRGRTRR